MARVYILFFFFLQIGNLKVQSCNVFVLFCFSGTATKKKSVKKKKPKKPVDDKDFTLDSENIFD